MIINLENLKALCSTILPAVDSSEMDVLTSTLQLETVNGYLHFSVTNREYYVDVMLDIPVDTEFKAAVNATAFLKLVSSITTSEIELTVKDTCLVIKGNGKYKLPLIFDGNELINLPEIKINNVTKTFNIDKDVLKSISLYNSKELKKDTVVKPIQKLYYLDREGCATFSSGACVNKFQLPDDISILLTQRFVQLFKLFFNSDEIKFELGYDSVNSSLIQTKVRLSTPTISVTVILASGDNDLKTFPIKAIRERAFFEYPYSIQINRAVMLDTLNRLLMFSNSSTSTYKEYSTITFVGRTLTLSNDAGEYSESIEFISDTAFEEPYVATINMKDIKFVLDTCTESHFNLAFGDHKALVIQRGNIYNLISEQKIMGV